MDKLLKVLRWICVIVLTVGIIIFGLASILSSSILNKDFALKTLEETDYYINTYSQANEDFENYLYQSGLNKEVLEGLITLEDVRNDTNTIIDNIYDGKEEPIDVEKVKERLSANITKNIEEKGIWVKSQESIDKYIEVILTQYEDSILHTEFENSIHEGINSINKLIRKATTISISMIGVAIIVLLVTFYKKFWNNMIQIGIPLVSAGAFYIFIDIYIRARVDIKNIMFMSNAMSYSLRTMIFNLFDIIRFTGIAMILVGFILILVGNIIRDKKHKHSRKK